MIAKDIPMYKALYFDLDTKKLRKYYSETSPNGGYAKIFYFMKKHGFQHAQGSGYHSKFKTTDVKIIELVQQMLKVLSWLGKCVNKFEVTDLGDNSNLMKVVFAPDIHILKM